MISAEAVMADYEKALKDPNLTDAQKVLECMRILLKLVVTVRSNQMLPESEKVRLFALDLWSCRSRYSPVPPHSP